MKSSKTAEVLYFFLWCSASFLVYNIAGVYYNTKRHGKRGVEAIPHIDKWRQVPDLLKILYKGALAKAIIGVAFARGYIQSKTKGYKETTA